MSHLSDTIKPLNISLFAVDGAKVIGRLLCVPSTSLLAGAAGGQIRPPGPGPPPILVRRLRARGRSPQGPPARARAPARGPGALGRAGALGYGICRLDAVVGVSHQKLLLSNNGQ